MNTSSILRLLLLPSLMACGRHKSDSSPPLHPAPEKVTPAPLAPLAMGDIALDAADCLFQQTYVDKFLATHATSFHREGGSCSQYERDALVVLPEWGDGVGPSCKADHCWAYVFTVAGPAVNAPAFSTLNSRGRGWISTFDSSPFYLFGGAAVETTRYAQIVKLWGDDKVPLMALTYRATLTPFMTE